MKNLKFLARKYHVVLGTLFALPLIYSALTGVSIVLCDEILHNEGLSELMVKYHTLEIIGLGDIYPFFLLIGIVGLITTAVIMRSPAAK